MYKEVIECKEYSSKTLHAKSLDSEEPRVPVEALQ